MIKQLINNISKLTEIQQDVETIEFEPENLLSRVKVDIEFKSDNKFKKYKTFIRILRPKVGKSFKK